MTIIGIGGQVVSAATATRTLHVDPDAGDDANVGTDAAAPLATIQEAVNRFLPLILGVPFWAINDDRRIEVHGSGKFQESIVIPPHAGHGALRIIGDETVVHSGLIEAATPFVSLSGFEVRRRLDFTTSPMTPGALADRAFIRPQVNLLGNPFEFQWDMFPIVDNAAGTVDVVAADPGILTGFSHGAGVIVDAVQPNRIWQPAASDDFGFFPPITIQNMGGALIVEAFEFQGHDDAFFNSGTVLSSVGALGDEFNGSTVILSRSIVKRNVVSGNFPSSVVAGDVVALAGCILDTVVSDPISIVGVRGLGFVNVRTLARMGIRNATLGAYGLDSDGETFLTNVNGFAYQDSRPAAADGVVVDGGGVFGWTALSVEGATGTGLTVGANTQCDINGNGGRIVGSTGNGRGARVFPFGYLRAITAASVALTGSAGDAKVGGNADRLWTAGSETDTVELARLLTT